MKKRVESPPPPPPEVTVFHISESLSQKHTSWQGLGLPLPL